MLRRLTQVNSSTALMAAVTMGAAFLVFSYIVGNLMFRVCWNASGILEAVGACPPSVEGGLTKEVGFASAFNWSLTFMAIFPFFLFFALQTAKSARQALRRLMRSEMLVTDKFDIPRMQELQKIIDHRLVLGGRVLLVLTLLIAAFLVADFLEVVLPFYLGTSKVTDIRLDNWTTEVDWSIAGPVCAAFDNAATECAKMDWMFWPNLVFAGLAYIALPWFGGVATCAFLVYFFLFAVMFTSADFARKGYSIIPDLDSKVSRRGFENLEGLFANATTAAFLAFAFGLLVVLQNVYLRAEEPSIVHMLTDANRLFAFLPNGNTIGVMTIGGLIAGAMMVAASVTLKRAAEAGRDKVLKAIRLGDPNVAKVMKSGTLTPAYVTKMLLKQFEYWPFKWFRLNTLLAALVVAVFALMFVNIGVYLVAAGLVLVWLQRRFLSDDGKPFRLLMGIANPVGTQPLPQLLDEMHDVNNVIDLVTSKLPRRSAFRHMVGPDVDTMKSELLTFRPTIIHLSGHGGTNGLILHDPTGFHIVLPDELKRMLMGSSVRVVVLNCCYSAAYSTVLLEAVDTVVGVDQAVFDDAAKEFGVELERAIVEGATIAEAAARGNDAAAQLHGGIAGYSVVGASDLRLVKV